MGWGDKLKARAAARGQHLPVGAHTISAEPLEAHDSQGRVLGVGDEIVMLQPGFLFRIARVEPFTAPGAPPNLMKITLVSSTDLVVPRGASIDGILRTARYAELKPADAAEHGEQGKPEPGSGVPVDAPAIHLTDSPLDPRD